MGNKAVFDRLVGALEARNERITNVLVSHQAEVGRIKATYSERVAAAKLADLIAQDRESIKAAHADAQSTAGRCVGELRELLERHVCAVPDPSAMEVLRTAQDFGLHLSEAEIQAMGNALHGNALGLSCLREIAATSGFALNFATAKDFSADLERLERGFSPSSWAPRDPALLAAALEVLPDRVYRGISQGRPDSVSISIAQGAADALKSDLAAMADRWAVVGDTDATSIFSLERLPAQTAQNAP